MLTTPPFSPDTAEEEFPEEGAQQPAPENEGASQFEGSQEDLKNFVEKMAAENQLDPEEYERIRQQIEERQK